MSLNTILFWIRLPNNQTYGSATYEDCRLVKVKAHKVRKIGTSAGLPLAIFRLAMLIVARYFQKSSFVVRCVERQQEKIKFERHASA